MPNSLALLLTAAVLVLGPAPSATSTSTAPEEIDPFASLTAIEPSVVVVHWRLRQDRGDVPLGRLAPNGLTFADAIASERPLELPGFLLDERTVLVRDPSIPGRFVDRISVRRAGAATTAVVDAWLPDRAALFLRLETPLEGARPLAFLEAGVEPTPPLSLLRLSDAQGVWALTAAAAPLGPSSPGDDRPTLELTDDGPLAARWAPSDALAVDARHRVVRVLVGPERGTDRTHADEGADPRRWARRTADEARAAHDRLRAATDATILRTTLHFRSPRKQRGGGGMPFEGTLDPIGTELECLSLVLQPTEAMPWSGALVLADLPPSATARLEGITLHRPDGTTTDAAFVGSLREWGAFLASLSGGSGNPQAGTTAPHGGTGLRLATTDLAAMRDRLLDALELRIVGRDRVADPMHARINAFEPGWNGIRFPTAIPQAADAFLFEPNPDAAAPRTLVALPLSRRDQPGGRDTWTDRRTPTVPASVIATVLARGQEALDPTNVPLSERDETRTGWLGVLLQPLEPELARLNGVADLTRDGEFGAIVTSVYEGSPAAAAGIRPGMILLDITTDRRQQPIEMVPSEADAGWGDVFPWERLDDLPEEAFDQVPAPWPPIADSINSMLTEIGIGSQYRLRYVSDGAPQTATLTVEQSPPHFGNAPRYEAESLGLTVRDLTLEIRQYLSLPPDAPGVVIARLEPGRRASLAGLRPFEIIESVNGSAIRSASEFETAVRSGCELKLTVKRAQRERVVTLPRLSEGSSSSADAPAGR